MQDPIREITITDSTFGDEGIVLRQYPDGIYTAPFGHLVKLTRAQLATIQEMLNDAAAMAPAPDSTPADLAAWADPQATMTDIPPDEIPDPAQHACMFHPEGALVPIAVRITADREMIGYACRPCGESILAVLHGTPPAEVPVPDAALDAASMSIWMRKMLGKHDATSVTGAGPATYDDQQD